MGFEVGSGVGREVGFDEGCMEGRAVGVPGLEVGRGVGLGDGAAVSIKQAVSCLTV